MPTAVISDIHANAEAFKRVLEDINRRKIDRIICLGDVVGYGPDPLECVDLVRKHCAWSLMGNHDFAVLYEPTNFNAGAESAAFWTRDQFDKETDAKQRADRYDFLGRLKVRIVEQQPDMTFPLLAIHGSPRRPINEYIFPDDVNNAPDKMEAIFDRVTTVAICGHTHVPGVFTGEPDFYPPDELGPEHRYQFRQGEKAIINVGSVGQPRDQDPRASYVILYPEYAQFVRVEYDFRPTQQKIDGIPWINHLCATRLEIGK